MEEEKVLKINTGVMETWPLIRVFPQAFKGGSSSVLGETEIRDSACAGQGDGQMKKIIIS